MLFHYLRPVTAYSRVIFAQISGDFERVCSQVSERSETPMKQHKTYSLGRNENRSI